MILVCPNCDARYRLADDAIPAQGRKVRCASCQHEWVEPPPAASAPDSPPAAVALETPPVSHPIPPPPEPEPEPAAESPPRSGGWLKTLVAIVVGAALTLTAVAIWGGQWGLDLARVIDLPVLRMAAPAASEAPAAEPLAISFTVQIGVLPNGTNLLSVSGEVANPTRERRQVPPMLAVLHDLEGRAVYSWDVSPPVAALDPGKSASFDTSASNFPSNAANLTLDFRPR